MLSHLTFITTSKSQDLVIILTQQVKKQRLKFRDITQDPELVNVKEVRGWIRILTAGDTRCVVWLGAWSPGFAYGALWTLNAELFKCEWSV